MAKRKAYGGTSAEHRGEAKHHLKWARGSARMAQVSLRKGHCSSALEMIERTAMSVGAYNAHRGEVLSKRRGLLGRSTLTSMLRRLNSQFNAKCMR